MEAGVDSVAMMDVIVWLEDTFGISIDPDDLTPENFGSVNRIVAYLER
jgi:acyl carrier protein